MAGGIDIPVMLVFLAVFLLCYLFLSKRGSNLPPGPTPLPIIGNLLWFVNLRRNKKRFYRVLHEESNKYGDVVYMKVGKQGYCFLQGYDTIREAFVKQADVHSNRPDWLPGVRQSITEGRVYVLPYAHSVAVVLGNDCVPPLTQVEELSITRGGVNLSTGKIFKKLRMNPGKSGILWQNGHDLKTMRKLAIQTLRDLGVGKTSLEEKIMAEVDAVTDVMTSSSDGALDVRHLTSMMITNVIYGIVFGKRFDFDEAELHDIIQNLEVFFTAGGFQDPTTGFPDFLIKTFAPGKWKERQLRRKTLQWVKQLIYHEIGQHEQTYDKNSIRDFVDLYVQAKQADDTSSIFTVGNLFRMVMDLFVAGAETTSTSLNWCILYMIEYPEVQKRCQAEMEQKYGDRVITWSDKGTLPYVEATILEIQRISSIAEQTLPHTNEVDTTIRGYRIPRHTVILANLYSACMDPKHWHRPEAFNPERFLEDGKLKTNAALIPFSLGPRVCPGESLAKMELFLAFCNLLQRFTLTREDANTPHTFECKLGHVTSVPVDYKCRAVRRS